MNKYNVVRKYYSNKKDWVNNLNSIKTIIMNYTPMTLEEAYTFRSKMMNPIDYNYSHYFTDFIKETD